MLAFLSELARIRAIPPLPTYQSPFVDPIFMDPRMDEAPGIDVFPHSVLGSVITNTEYELLKKI